MHRSRPLYLACLIVAILLPARPAGADIVILKYDDKGRVIGSSRSTSEAGAGAKRGTGARTAAPAPRRPSSRSPARYVGAELLVANPPAGFVRRLPDFATRVIERISLAEFDVQLYRLALRSNVAPPAAKRRLAARFPGLLVDVNPTYEPAAAPEETESHARALIGWRRAGAGCGAGIRLGMIDTPVDTAHPAFTGQQLEYRSFHNPSRRPGAANHGTAIAAMIIGRSARRGWGGLLPGVELKAANMFELNGSGKMVGNGAGLLKALNWLASKRVHAVNLSVAGPDNDILRLVFDRARDKGLVMIAAAGNWGSADRPAFPAAYPHVVAVTAIGADRAAYRYANRGKYIDFAAPGVGIWTAVPGGGKYQSGTSFATPYIAVLIALEIAQGRPRNPEVLRAILRRHAIDLGRPGKDTVFGWGLIDMPRRCVG